MGPVRYKLRIQMVLFNVLISVVPIILVGVIANSVNFHNMKKSVSSSVDILFTQVNGRIEEYFDEINAISKSVFLNKSLQSIYQTDEAEWTKFTRIQDHLNAYLETNESIKGIYWYDQNGSVYNTSAFPLRKEMDQIVLSIDSGKLNDGELYLTGPIEQNGKIIDEYAALRQIKTVIESDYLQPMGIGAMILDRTRLINIIEDSHMSENSQLYVVDDRNRIIVSTDKSQTGHELNERFFHERENDQLIDIEGVSYLVKVSSVNKAGWKLVAAIDADKLFAEGNVFKYYITLIVVIVFVTVVVITLFFNIVITKPINRLIDAFAQVASGDLESKVRFAEKNEVTRMAVHFNRMVKEIGELTNRQVTMQQELYETELKKKQFELNGLQSQINAHFLYNTLHTLRGMALSNSADDASRMIENLVDYFRYCSRSDEYVQLGAELDYLETYLDIQKARFGSRLKISVETDERLHDQAILKLLIQPLVENAIFHGIEQKHGNGIVKVSVALADSNRIRIRVLDNGLGIGARKVEQLNLALAGGDRSSVRDDTAITPKDKRSIGIMNINKRVKLYYGPEYGLSIKSWENTGTAIIMTIPYAKEAANDV